MKKPTAYAKPTIDTPPPPPMKRSKTKPKFKVCFCGLHQACEDLRDKVLELEEEVQHWKRKALEEQRRWAFEGSRQREAAESDDEKSDGQAENKHNNNP